MDLCPPQRVRRHELYLCNVDKVYTIGDMVGQFLSWKKQRSILQHFSPSIAITYHTYAPGKLLADRYNSNQQAHSVTVPAEDYHSTLHFGGVARLVPDPIPAPHDMKA